MLPWRASRLLLSSTWTGPGITGRLSRVCRPRDRTVLAVSWMLPAGSIQETASTWRPACAAAHPRALSLHTSTNASSEDASQELHHLQKPTTSAFVSRQTHDDGTGSDSIIEQYTEARQSSPNILADWNKEQLSALCRKTVGQGRKDIINLILGDVSQTKPSDGEHIRQQRIVVLHGIADNAMTRAQHTLEPRQASSSASSSGAGIKTLLSASTVHFLCKLLTEDAVYYFEQQDESTQQQAVAAPVAGLSDTSAQWLLRVILEVGDEACVPLISALWSKCTTASDPSLPLFPTAEDAIQIASFYFNVSTLVSRGTIGTAAYSLNADPTLPPHIAVAQSIIEEGRRRHPDTFTDGVLYQSSQEANAFGETVARAAEILEMPESCLSFANAAFTITNINLSMHNFGLAHRIMLTFHRRADRYYDSSSKSRHQTRALVATKLRMIMNLAAYSPQGRQSALQIIQESAKLLALSSSNPIDHAWLEALCGQAIANNEPVLAIDAVQGMVKHLSTNIPAIIGSENLLCIVEEFARKKRAPEIRRLLNKLEVIRTPAGNPVLHESINAFFTPSQRPRLLIALSTCLLHRHCKRLYGLWGKPQPNDIKEYRRAVSEFVRPQRVANQRKMNLAASDDPAASVTLSTQCMSSLVACILKASDEPKSLHSADYRFALHVLLAYIKGRKTIASLDESEIPLLASTLCDLSPSASEVTFTSESLDFRKQGVECFRELSRRGKQSSSGGLHALIPHIDQMSSEDACQAALGLGDNKAAVRELGAATYVPMLALCCNASHYISARRVLNLIRSHRLIDERSTLFIEKLLACAMVRRSEKSPTESTGVLQGESARRNGALSQKAANAQLDSDATPYEVVSSVAQMLSTQEWRPDPLAMSCLIQQAFSMPTDHRLEGKEERASTQRENRRVALELLSLCSTHLGHLDTRVIQPLAKCFQHAAMRCGHTFKEPGSSLTEELDRAVGILRWVPELRRRGRLSGGFDREGTTSSEGVKSHTHDVQSETRSRAQQPNHLDVRDYRALLFAYIYMGDISGAAQILEWVKETMHDPLKALKQSPTSQVKRKAGSAKYNFDNTLKQALHANRRKFGNPNEAKHWIRGKVPIPHTKSWWQPSRLD